MPANKVFIAPERGEAEFTYTSDIDIDPPLQQEEKVSQPLFQRIMPFIMIAVMLLMLVMMFTIRGGGSGFNPMMMMFPVMMMMSMMSMFMNNAGGNNIAELNKERKDYVYNLREKRKMTHKAGEEVHDVITRMFPNPAILANYVGNKDLKDPVMWQARPDAPGGISAFEGTDHEVSFRPYMSARLGVGITNLIPPLTFEPLSVPETLDPGTAQQFRAFVRTQGFIPNIPIGLGMDTSPAFAFTGDEEKRYGLVRAMLCSLAFNHSPNVLRIAVVTDNVEDEKWSWLKWLPHAHSPFKEDRVGPVRMVYSTMREMAEDTPQAVGGIKDGQPRWIIVVDKPYDAVEPPLQTSLTNSSNATYIVVAAGADYIARSRRGRFEVTNTSEIKLPFADTELAGDYMSIDDADVFARSMMAWRPPTPTETSSEDYDAATPFVHRTWFDVLGIRDIEEWDPQQAWAMNENNEALETPVGLEFNEAAGKSTDRVVVINAAESGQGGSGPHGIGQGRSGSGKSVMISAYVLGLIARYSPLKVNFILMDFKGGSTFQGYEKLPHVIASLSNLAGAEDLLDRAQLVIQGEINRRQEVLDSYNVEDIVEYRKLAAKDPSMPPMPHLFIVADEFREFITKNREFLKLFESIAAVGRSLGTHLFLVSQFIDSALIGDVGSQVGYALSLAVNKPAESRGAIDTDKAAELSTGKGDAIILFREGETPNTYQRFRVFYTKEDYVAPTRETRSFDVTTIDQETDEAVSHVAILDYTVSRQEAESAPIIIDAEEVAEPEPAEEEYSSAEEEDERVISGRMSHVLINRIARETDAPRALPMWKRSMREPLSYHDVALSDMSHTYPSMKAVLGVVDDPYNHDQYAWTIDFARANTNNILVMGDRGSGKTVFLETVISSLSCAYPPEAVQFIILAYSGGKIKEIEQYPQVIGLAMGNDDDSVERYIGEIRKIIRVRQKTMTMWGSTDATEYLKSKVSNEVKGDPYGRVFFIVDGVEQALKDPQRDEELTARLNDVIREVAMAGPSVGIHLIATGLEQGAFGYHLAPQVPTKIIFHTSDKSMIQDSEMRLKMSKIPADQPGRSVDPSSGLYSRVFVPQQAAIAPVGKKKGNDIYNVDENFGPGVEEMARAVNEQYRSQEGLIIPKKIRPAPAQLPYANLWKAYGSHIDSESRNVFLPLGVSTEDLSVVDMSRRSESPHIHIVGESLSGKTNVLRVLINDIVSQRGKKGAKFIFYDPRNEFFAENKILRSKGMSAGYTSNPKEFLEIADQLADKLESRIPTSEMMETMSRDSRMNRGWYSGADFFLIVDNIDEVNKEIGYDQCRLAEILKKRTDLGCYVLATARSSAASGLNTTSQKLSEALINSGGSALVLSGSKEDGAFAGVRFKKQRPGRGVFYGAQTGTVSVQVPLADPWDED